MGMSSEGPNPPPPPLPDGRERRKNPRRLIPGRGSLTVLDGLGAGDVHEVQTRDLSLAGLSFLLKVPLAVGQACRIEVPGEGAFLVEVVRSRPLSNGKYEMGVQVRRRL